MSRDILKVIRSENWKQISLPDHASKKLDSLSKNFRYGKKLKKAKTVEAMSWQYNIIKNTNEKMLVYI